MRAPIYSDMERADLDRRVAVLARLAAQCRPLVLDADDDPQADALSERRRANGAYRRLLQGMLAVNIWALQEWCWRWQFMRDNRTPQIFLRLLTLAIQADDWLREPHEFDAAKLTCGDVCDALELAHDQVVAKLYATLDPVALAVLRSTTLAAKAMQRNQQKQAVRLRQKKVIRAAVAFLEIVGKTRKESVYMNGDQVHQAEPLGANQDRERDCQGEKND